MVSADAARPARLSSPPAISTGRALKRSTSIPAGTRATAEPTPTAANTAPNPAGPTCSAERMCDPMAGSPKLIIENAACEATASIRIRRWRVTASTVACATHSDNTCLG